MEKHFIGGQNMPQKQKVKVKNYVKPFMGFQKLLLIVLSVAIIIAGYFGVTYFIELDNTEYTVQFNTLGGEEMGAFTYTKAGGWTVAEPSKDGYNFAGWYTDLNFSNEFDVKSKITSNIYLYAKWEAQEFTITFNTNGGSAVSVISAPFESSITLPVSEKTGYDFGGWYADSDLENAFTSSTLTLNGATLWAKWDAIEYTITYHLDGGDNDVNNLETFNIETSTFTLVDPYKMGYTFIGWFQESNYENSAIITIQQGSIGEREFFAKWLINEYQIIFIVNGGDAINSLLEPYQSPITVPDAERENYEFKGWFKDADFNVPFTDTLMPLNGATVYAKWEVITYSITYNLFGAVNNPENITEFTYETPNFTLLDPEFGGIEFLGWYDNAQFSGEQITELDFSVLEDIELFARWDFIPTVVLDFEPNGGDPVSSILETPGTSIVLPVTSRQGYTFEGWWYYDTEEEVFLSQFTATTMPFHGATLYAKWEPIEYTITFEVNDGSAVADITQGFDTEITLPVTTKQGYTFEGWFFYDTVEEVFLAEFTATKMPFAGAELYAKWEAIEYTITFEVNNGSAVANITQDFDTEITLPLTTKQGYTFEGWFFYDTVEEVFLAEFTATKMPFEGAELYAKWEAIEYTITFEANGGDAVADLIQGYETEIELPTTSRLGYTFEGWFTDDETFLYEFTSETMPFEGAELFAKWEAIEYTITFEVNDGSPVSNITQAFDTEITLPVTTKHGYTFEGWYFYDTVEEVFLAEFTATKMPFEGAELYAKWTLTEYDIIYHLYDGINSIDNPDTYNIYSGEIPLYAPSKTGFVFDFWYSDEFFENVIWTIPAESYGEVNVYANWVDERLQFFYHNDFTEVEVTGCDPNATGSIVIPYKYQDLPVTRIAEGAFMGIETITEVIMPDSIVELGQNVFMGCTGLESVILSESLLAISNYAFMGCTALSYIDLPINLELIGMFAFANSGLTSIIIPESVVVISFGSFVGCVGITEINLPNSLLVLADGALAGTRIETIIIPDLITSIASSLFLDCVNLTSITIPEQIISIGNSAFEGCTSLTNIIIPNSIEYIGSNAFLNCTSLEEVIFETGIQLDYIQISVFENCSSLTSILIPESVTEIRRRAFYGCSSLTEIFISEFVSYIEDIVFAECNSLVNIFVSEDNNEYKDVNGVLYHKSGYKLLQMPQNKNVVTYEIPLSVEYIDAYAFYGNPYIESIYIDEGVVNIGENAFSKCANLAVITVNSLNLYYQSIDGVLYNKSGNTLIHYPAQKTALSYVAPFEIEYIAANAFNGNTYLESIVLDENITYISNSAFENCSNLISITIRATMPPNLGNNVFDGVHEDFYVMIPMGTLAIYNSYELWAELTLIEEVA